MSKKINLPIRWFRFSVKGKFVGQDKKFRLWTRDQLEDAALNGRWEACDESCSVPSVNYANATNAASST